MGLETEIRQLRNNRVKNKIDKRLRQFESFKKKSAKEWFSELCFCILTANSRAETALKIQGELGHKGFCTCTVPEITNAIKRNKHRFHNNKARYIEEARRHVDIKNILAGMTEFEAREWLVGNVKGIGYKEASHFLRNVGHKNLAILDRHIISLLLDSGKLKARPKSLNRKRYLQIEKKFNRLAQDVKMSSAELDMYMWHMKTGKVIK